MLCSILYINASLTLLATKTCSTTAAPPQTIADEDRRHLTPHGVLAFHISNLHINLEPAVALLAASAGMQARRVSTGSARQPGEFSSTWMLVTADPNFFAQPELLAVSHLPVSKPDLRVWTDDYSALFPLTRR